MAAPITTIKRHEPAAEEIREEKLNDLKTLLAQQDIALNKMINILSELNENGMLEAVHSMLLAKEKIAAITLSQVTREPVTNLINNLMGAAGALTSLDPETTKKLINGLTTGIAEANQHLIEPKKVGVLDLLKVLNDPDINRAIGFSLQFLKGLGKGLKEE
jgi:uncharacterized protein YjgD (DUF1641 family)